jgi:hypothetical protein
MKPMSRPLCPYPQSAKYKGSGDPYDAASFVCGNDDAMRERSFRQGRKVTILLPCFLETYVPCGFRAAPTVRLDDYLRDEFLRVEGFRTAGKPHWA